MRLSSSLFGFFLCGSIFLVLAACSTELPYISQKQKTVPYTLAAGDVLNISAAEAEDISGDYTLGDNGEIDLPMIGRINLNGMTLAQSDQLITELYANGYLVNPDISLQLENYRPFFIMGEISNPGKYDYEEGLTVLNAVAIAGGFTYRANQNQFEIVRRQNPNDEIGTRKLTQQSLSTSLQPGDTVYVKERLF